MKRFKSQNNIIILLLFSLCLFMKCISGEDTAGMYPGCTVDAPYKMLFDLNTCVSKSQCASYANQLSFISLTGADEWVCSKEHCQPQIINKPGYYFVNSQMGFSECFKCPLDKPISVNNVCGQCPDKLVFTYVKFSAQASPCITLEYIWMQKDNSGIFDSQMKIYYDSNFIIPQNAIVTEFQAQWQGVEQTFRLWQWCPFDKPRSEDGVTCLPCLDGFVPQMETHSCVSLQQCSILSMDGQECYKSSCPLGQFIDKTNNSSWKCNICTGNQFPSSDQTQCVMKCSDIDEVLHEATSACIKFEDCDGFYSDKDKTICLKSSCLRELATVDLAANILFDKQGKNYQVCYLCPKDQEFIKKEGENATMTCKNCSVYFQGTISDYVTGVCKPLGDINVDGILNEDSTKFYPKGKYTCKNGYYPTPRSNSYTQYSFCDKCPQNIPFSDGITCSKSCPPGQVADWYKGLCIENIAGPYPCEGRLSSNGLVCSSTCLQGEKNLGQYDCERCPQESPNSSKDFTKCLSNAECFYDSELQICMEYASDCQKKGKDYYYQNNSQTCKKGCEQDEIITFKNNVPSCINKCTDIQFTYFADVYQYCRDACEQIEYAILETKTCKLKTDCYTYITGTPNQCLDSCVQGEVLIDEKPMDQNYFECVNPTQCKAALVEQSDKTFVCTTNCKSFVNDETRKCVDECPSDFYQDNEKTNSNYYICYRSCPDGKLNFTSPIDGKKSCILQNECSSYLDISQKECVNSCDISQFVLEKQVGQTFRQCLKVCDKIKFIDDKGVKNCVSTCSEYLQTDSKDCQKSCNPTDFIYDKPENQSYIQCSQDCTDIAFIDDKDIKRCMKTCSYYLSPNKNECRKSCNRDEFINEQVEGQTYIQCSTSCPQSTYQYTDDKGVMYCIKECNLYLSSDKTVCLNSCPKEEFTREKNGLSYNLCSKDCDLFSQTDEKGIKRCTPTCLSYVATNGTDCNKSCQENDYVNDKKQNDLYFICSTTCDDFKYDTGDKIKRCGKVCPNNQITYKNKTKSKCLKTKKECPEIISYSGNECISKCDPDKLEYTKTMNGFKQCFSCEGYYNSQDQSCSQTCAANEIGFPSTHQCLNKSDGEKKCKDLNFKLSADKTKCTEKCEYPEITRTSGECTLPCDPKNTQCSNCSEGEYILSDGLTQTCTNSCGQYFISSDNKRCIQKCSYLREQTPQNGKQCEKCKENEVLVLESLNTYICKSVDDVNIFEEKIKTAQDQVSKEMKSKDQIDEFKIQVSEIASETFKKLTVPQDKSPKQLIDQVVNLGKSMIKNIAIPEIATAPNKLGSSDNILVQIQKADTNYKFKKNLDFDEIQSNNNYSLTEENLDQDEETISSLAAIIIASNPTCKTDDCKSKPLFTLDITESKTRRILQTNNDFTITFNLKDSTDIQKYICFTYDLSDPTADPKQMQTTIGSNNKSITCQVSGSVSIMLDSTCLYVDKQLCLKNDNESDDDELNGGEIAGIVIGVIAFVGLSTLIVLEIIKKNKLKKQKQYEQPNNNVKHEQFHTEERVNTLGINFSEKQV